MRSGDHPFRWSCAKLSRVGTKRIPQPQDRLGERGKVIDGPARRSMFDHLSPSGRGQNKCFTLPQVTARTGTS
jgi:hypothetical protein